MIDFLLVGKARIFGMLESSYFFHPNIIIKSKLESQSGKKVDFLQLEDQILK